MIQQPANSQDIKFKKKMNMSENIQRMMLTSTVRAYAFFSLSKRFLFKTLFQRGIIVPINKKSRHQKAKTAKREERAESNAVHEQCILVHVPVAQRSTNRSKSREAAFTL